MPPVQQAGKTMKYKQLLLTLSFAMSFIMLGAIWVGLMSFTNSSSVANATTLLFALPVAITLVFLVHQSRKMGRSQSQRPRAKTTSPEADYFDTEAEMTYHPRSFDP